MPWWINAVLAGILIALGCIGAGYLLARATPVEQWTIPAFFLLVLITIYLVATGIPRRYAPSHTRGPRDAIQHAGLERPAFLLSRNPGVDPATRTPNPDFLITAIPPALAALILGFTL